jgi:Ca2+-binding RTX toxin-like protein
MATLSAFRATDMRVEIARGLLTSFRMDTIEVSDGAGADIFRGLFSVTPQGFVGGTIFDPFAPAFPQPGDLPVLLFAQVSGTLAGYDVLSSDGTLRYSVDVDDLNARSAFQTLAFRGTDAFQALVLAGDDNLYGSRFADVLIGYRGADMLSGRDGDDRLLGRAGSDRLYGGDGEDVLRGGGARDWLFGGDDDDALFGDRGVDTLRGEDGDDRLTGGLNRDYLNGGDGDDTFRFTSIRDSRPGSETRDQVQDFTRGDDLVDLRPIDADLTQRGNQAFVFLGDAPFTDQPGQLRFDPESRLLQGDTTGDGEADFEVAFTTDVQLEADDFLL